MAKQKATFGSMATCKVRYVIAILYNDNSVKFLTDVHYEPHKYCEWLDGKPAYFFDDRKYAEDICFGLNVNGTGSFVMEVPDYFEDRNFGNPEKEKEDEKSD